MRELEGTALQEFVSREFRDLADGAGLLNGECRIVDQGKGLRSWTGSGASTIVWPPAGADSRVIDYDRIESGRRSDILNQLRTHVAVHAAKTFGWMH